MSGHVGVAYAVALTLYIHFSFLARRAVCICVGVGKSHHMKKSVRAPFWSVSSRGALKATVMMFMLALGLCALNKLFDIVVERRVRVLM